MANGAMCVLLIWLTPAQDVWFAMVFWERLIAMLLICLGGALTYGASLKLTGFQFKAMVR